MAAQQSPTTKSAVDGLIGGVSGARGGAGTGNIILNDAGNLGTQNIIRAFKNHTKNGFRGALKRYFSSAPVKRFFKSTVKSVPKSFFDGTLFSVCTDVAKDAYSGAVNGGL